MPRTETADSELGSQVLSLGSFLGQRPRRPVWKAGGKEWFWNLCAHFPTPRPRFQPASLGAATFPFTNPTGRGPDSLEFPRKKEKHATHCCLLCSRPAPPWAWFGETSCSQESPDTQTLGSQTHRRDEGESRRRGPITEPAAAAARAFGGLPIRSPVCVQMSRLWSRRIGFQLSFIGARFLVFPSLAFLVRKVRVKTSTSKGDDEVSGDAKE